MQLSKMILISVFILPLSVIAQSEIVAEEPIEIDFLVNYYSQDGDHSPVTGGKGTEQLTESSPMVIVHIPYANGQKLSVTTGFSAYSSASTGYIDMVMSGESSSDIRGFVNADYSWQSDDKISTYGILMGGSVEYDYRSFSIGGQYTRQFANGNSEISLKAKAFFDEVDLIYPIEFRPPGQEDGDNLGTDKRYTYNLSAVYSQVLSTRAQMSIAFEPTIQNGFLSTAFHRVYFAGADQAALEKLPDSRVKFPLSLRLNYYMDDWIISRSFYRYYTDDFGITAHTFNQEFPIRFNQTYSIIPFYRFSTQSESDYFAPYGEHSGLDEFYTSDFDLSGFNSHKFGLGFRYYPLKGLGSFGVPLLDSGISVKKFELRVAQYNRSDGLKSINATLGLSFQLR
jgi:hypothetical protein